MIVEPFFLASPSGRLFAVHHRPRNVARIRGHVLCIAPFNEEMNRCRSMMTLQAEAFAEIGLGTLVFDLHGTGDSSGEYCDARWANWLADIQVAANWANAQPGGLKALLGVRLGAILAAESYAGLGGAALALILWQPVADGKVHLTQFLRVRMAAQLDRPDLPKENTTTMRQQLAAGQNLEVAGYEIHPELANAIEKARLLDHALPAGSKVLWLENASPENSEISAPGKKAALAWQGADASVDAVAFSGPAFWQLYERAVSPDIIEKTSRWLHDRLDAQ